MTVPDGGTADAPAQRVASPSQIAAWASVSHAHSAYHSTMEPPAYAQISRRRPASRQTAAPGGRGLVRWAWSISERTSVVEIVTVIALGAAGGSEQPATAVVQQTAPFDDEEAKALARRALGAG